MSGSDRTRQKRDRRRTLIIGIIAVVAAAIGLGYIITHLGAM